MAQVMLAEVTPSQAGFNLAGSQDTPAAKRLKQGKHTTEDDYEPNPQAEPAADDCSPDEQKHRHQRPGQPALAINILRPETRHTNP